MDDKGYSKEDIVVTPQLEIPVGERKALRTRKKKEGKSEKGVHSALLSAQAVTKEDTEEDRQGRAPVSLPTQGMNPHVTGRDIPSSFQKTVHDDINLHLPLLLQV